MDTTTELKLISVDKLIPYANNARTHSKEQINKLRSSLREFGFINPIIIDKDYNVIAGHGRLAAAKAEQMKEVPCVFVDHLTEAQKKAYILADNRMAMDSDWDEEMLKVELESLEEMNVDLKITGFEEDELSKLLNLDTEAQEDEFDVDAALDKPAFVKRGEKWVCGKHTLMCGDSTKVEDVQYLMNGVMADMIVTDPPYNVNYEGGTKDKLKIANDNMDEDSFRKFLVAAFGAGDSVLKPGGVFYIWHADSEGYNFRGACNDVGWKIRECLIWEKNAMVMGRQDYQWQHEPCLYGWKDGASHLWASDRSQTTILKFNKPVKNDIHPTMKPIPLFDYQIKNNTKGGDVVLDLFGGSGTTMMACEQNGRIAYLMEFDEKYASAIVRRYVELSGGDAYTIRDGKEVHYSELEKPEDLVEAE